MDPRRRRNTPALLAALGLALSAPATARAGVWVGLMGDQDFAAGTRRVDDSRIRATGVGEPAPFNVMSGDDRTGSPGSLGRVHFTHAVDPAALSAAAGGVRSASLTLGLLDIDSPRHSPATVRLYLDGVAQPLRLLRGISASHTPSSADVVTVPVPINLLKDGSLTVELRAIRRAPGFSGNAIGVDFSRLTINTVSPIPGDTPTPPGPTDPPGPPVPPLPPGPPAPHDPPPQSVPLPGAAAAGANAMLVLAGLGLLRRFRRQCYRY